MIATEADYFFAAFFFFDFFFIAMAAILCLRLNWRLGLDADFSDF